MNGAVWFFDIFSCFIISFQMIVFLRLGSRTNGCLACGMPHSSSTGISPPASRWALPIACDALNARTVAVGEYLTFCVSSPMRCQAHFAVRVGIAHFTEGHSAPAVRLGTEGMYLSAFMLRRSCLPGFLCQRPVTEGGKGNTPCFWLLHR